MISFLPVLFSLCKIYMYRWQNISNGVVVFVCLFCFYFDKYYMYVPVFNRFDYILKELHQSCQNDDRPQFIIILYYIILYYIILYYIILYYIILYYIILYYIIQWRRKRGGGGGQGGMCPPHFFIGRGAMVCLCPPPPPPPPPHTHF